MERHGIGGEGEIGEGIIEGEEGEGLGDGG